MRVRLIQGSHEEQHSFVVHGMRWPREWHNPRSVLVNQQTLGISEAFTLDIDPKEASPYGPGDHLWSFHAMDDLWLGCWGLIRAVVPGSDPEFPPLRIEQAYVDRLEAWCDEYNEHLEPLRSFILSGGTPGAAHLHVARTVVRRAERSTWALLEAEPDRTNREPALYLNRLSDLLFILSRTANPGGDVLWSPGGDRP